MKREIIKITENQKLMLENHIRLTENQVYVNVVKSIIKDIIQNYEPLIDKEFNGIDYNRALKIQKKTDGLVITPLELLNYLCEKSPGVNPELIRQIIRDWFDGDLDEDKILNKNIPLAP